MRDKNCVCACSTPKFLNCKMKILSYFISFIYLLINNNVNSACASNLTIFPSPRENSETSFVPSTNISQIFQSRMYKVSDSTHSSSGLDSDSVLDQDTDADSMSISLKKSDYGSSKLLDGTHKKLMELRDRERERENHRERDSRNYLQADRKQEILENMVVNLQREIGKLRDSLDVTNRKMRELETEQEVLKRPTPTIFPSPIPSFNREDTKTRKLINRLHFSDKCGGLVELSEVSEISYVRPSTLDDYNDGPETCVWIIVTSTHNQVGMTLRGLEPARGYPDTHGSDTYGLSTQVLDNFPKPQLKNLEARDVDREHIAPASEVILVFSTANATRHNQGFRLSLRNVEKRKQSWQVTVHTEWNCLGDKNQMTREIRYPFGGGNYGNQTSVYFIFHPGTGKRVWISADFARVPNYQSKLTLYKYSAEHQEFRQLAKLVRYPNHNLNPYNLNPTVDSGDLAVNTPALPEDRQYVGNPSQPILLHLHSPPGGWGEGFKMAFSYQHA